jgi:RraA family protein
MTAHYSLISTLLPGRRALRSDHDPDFPRPGPGRDAATGRGTATDRPIRVLMITEASGGGAGRHVLDLSEGLLARGCDVHLIYSPGQADRFFREHLERIDALKQAPCPLRKKIHPGDLPALRRIRRYIRDFGPFDIIHGHSAKGGALARLAALATATPAFYTPHGLVLMDPGVPLRKRLFYQAIEWTLGGVTRRIITVSPEEQRLAVRKGIGRSRVSLIPNGIAPIAFPPRAVVRRGLGLSEDSVAIGFIGRLVDQKAPEVLVKAFAMVAHGEPLARLIVVGSGPLELPLRNLADRLGIGGRILWLGERDGTAVLPGLDLFAIASRKEGLPYVLLEAMAAGLPIVATATAGVELLVDHGRNGFIVPPNCPESFAAALGDLTSDPHLRAQFGRASLGRAAEFTTEAMVDRTIATYRHCLRGADRSADPPRSLDASPEDAFSNPLTARFQGVSIMVSKPRSSEMHPGPGFRVKLDVDRPDPGLMEAFRDHATPDISDLLNRLYAVDPAIRCLTGDHHVLCGPACTVKVFPGDNLMVHKALDVAKPGDIVVVDARGSTQNAVLGDLISTKARHRGIAGFIVDGLIRDLPSILPLDFPVFARGTTPIGPLHRGPGEINYPICCGGVVVSPGDLVVADAAGIIVIPGEIAPELLERLNLHDASNRAYLESVRRGDFSNRWVDQLLEEHRCPIVETPGSYQSAAATNGAGSRHGSRPTNGRAAALVDEGV